MENEKKDFTLRRNNKESYSKNGWYFKYEDVKKLRISLRKSLPHGYSLIELDNLLNQLFVKGIIK